MVWPPLANVFMHCLVCKYHCLDNICTLHRENPARENPSDKILDVFRGVSPGFSKKNRLLSRGVCGWVCGLWSAMVQRTYMSVWDEPATGSPRCRSLFLCSLTSLFCLGCAHAPSPRMHPPPPTPMCQKVEDHVSEI